MPPVQNAIVGRVLRNFSKVSGFTTRIESFRLLWFDHLELAGVSITDPEGNKMIGARSILINFNLTELFNQRDVNIDGIVLNGAEVYLTMIQESDTVRDLNINIFIYELNKLSKAEGDGKSPTINIGEAVLSESLFTYIHPYRDSVSSGFDYNHFVLEVDEAQVQNFLVLGDTVQFDVRTLLLQDQKTKFNIHQLSTFFRISQASMEFTNLYLKAGQSFISDSVIFTYNSQRDLQEFVNKVKIYTHLNEAIIHPNDLALFAPGAEQIGKPIRISGKGEGLVRKFQVTNMNAAIGNTLLIGSLEMDGLPEVQETFILVNLQDSNVEFTDLRFLFNEPTLDRLKPFGRVAVNGQFLGYPSDFVAHGNFNSNIGRITSDINFKVDEEHIDKSSYTGKLKMVNFDLGKYLGDTVLFQKVTLDGNLRGRGLTTETANFTLNGKISSLGFKGYNYTTITTNATFASEFFSGILTIDDPNLKFEAKGSVDLRDNRNVIKVIATLHKAVFHELNLSSQKIYMRTNLDVDIKGLELDSLIGTADMSDFFIAYGTEEMYLQNIHLNSEKQGKNRMVNLETTLFDLMVEGDYLFSNLANDLNRLTNEMVLHFNNDENKIKEYYRIKRKRPNNYQAAFTLNIKDIKPISHLLKVDVTTSSAKIEGSFTSGYTSIFRAYTLVDSIRIQNNLFLATEAEISASKIADSTNILALGFINSQKQRFKSGLTTENIVFEGIWNRNRIDFELDADQTAQGNYIRLTGNVDFMPDSTRIKLLPSAIHLLERDWQFNPANEIVMRHHEWDFRNLELLNRQQALSVNGQLSEDPSRTLTLKASNLDLTILNVISDKKFTGTLNAEVMVDNYFKEPSVQNILSIDSLTINDFLIGDVNGKNIWDTEYDKFNINLFVDRLGKRIVNLQGAYTPQQESPLDVTAILEKANLKIIEPFLEEIFSTIDGTVSGTFNITGKLDDPAINGEGQVRDGQIIVAYTRTSYLFTGVIGLRPTSIYFKDIELTDAFRNKGRLSGSIAHRNFNDMRINVEASFRNFQVLNTTARDNSLFYGQGYASGTVKFLGPISHLAISSTAKTERNTRFYIPIGDTGAIEKEDFINFVRFNDTTATVTAQKSSRRVDLTGITFDLNLEVTPDAYAEIIFDLKAGDIIRGRGTGDLKLQMDTKGEFNMFGVVQFNEGWYNFTLYDIINKEFQIQKGSRITWHGDPYAATLNINANYNQLASFGPLVNDQDLSNSAELKRKYPVQVLLKLDGPMLSPNITFDISANDLPKSVFIANNISLDFLFESFKNRLDEQELKRQVFSLIVLRKFSPPESFNTSGTLYNSVSELLSNQLSYWMSQVDDNLEIDVDLGTMDQEAFNTFQLRLSYTFLNGRLRVTRDGMIGNTDYRGNNVSNQGNLNSVAGDWTVDYFLTADGKFKVKMYNRTTFNQLATSLNNQNLFTTGVSLQHVQSFNELRDLVRSARKRAPADNPEQQNLKPNNEAIKEEDGG